MELDNPEIVRLLGMGMTWDQIEQEARRRKLDYRRPCCAGCGIELSIPEVVRDATYCYSCEKKEEAAREEEKRLEKREEDALYGIVALARLLPVPWLAAAGLVVAAALGLAHSRPSSRR